MPRRHDDLEPWRDDPLVRALTAPGTPEELAGEHRALEVFRQAGPRPLRALHRLGAGSTALVIALGASGGVAAAAYSRSLPEPLQRAASTVFGWAAVPPPVRDVERLASGHHARLAAHRTGVTGTPGAAPAPPTGGPTPLVVSSSNSPGPRVGRPPRAGAAPARPNGASSSPTASPAPIATPSSSAPSSPPAVTTSPPPSSSPPAQPQPATMTATVNHTRVPYNGTAELSGQLLDADGNPVPHHRASVWQRQPGGGWQLLAYLRSDANGDVQTEVGPITTNLAIALRCAHLRSDGFRIVMLPTLSGGVASDDRTGTDTVALGSQGAAAGDAVTVLRRVDGRWQSVARLTLDGNGYASYSRPQPKRPVVLRFVLRADAEHGPATAKVVLPARS